MVKKVLEMKSFTTALLLVGSVMLFSPSRNHIFTFENFPFADIGKLPYCVMYSSQFGVIFSFEWKALAGSVDAHLYCFALVPSN